MLKPLKTFIHEEIKYFKILNLQERILISSFSLAGVTDPILFIFLNAFLWQHNHSLSFVAFYNLGLYISLPIIFYINGRLLHKISPGRLYGIGVVSQGIVAALLIFFPVSSYPSIFLFGALYGIGMGLFWANRNSLTLRLTETSHRIYFSSLEATIGTITGIIVPFAVGWFIIFGQSIRLYTHSQGYQILSIVTIGILFFVGYTLKNIKVTVSDIHAIVLYNPTKQWDKYRLLTTVNGLFGGVFIFLPTIIILTIVGNEAALGTVQSSAAVVSAIAVYYLSKNATAKHRIHIFTVSILMYLIGSLIFGITFSSLGALIFFACNAVAYPFGWVGITSMGFDLIDREKEKHPAHEYAFIFDQELFLNIGRVLGIVIFISFITFFSKNFVLRYSPFFFSAIQLIQIFIMKALNDPETK